MNTLSLWRTVPCGAKPSRAAARNHTTFLAATAVLLTIACLAGVAPGQVASSGPAGADDANAHYQVPNLSGGPNSLVGLKADGTIVVFGGKELGIADPNAAGWKNIVQVAAGWHHLVALRKDGTVLGVGDAQSEANAVARWKGVVAVAAGYAHVLGLKSDGTVLAVGGKWGGQCNVGKWRDIVAAAAGGVHSVGLKKDGNVVATGSNQHGQCDVDEWRNIVAIAAGQDHTVGLRADGTVVAAGRNNVGQCNVGKWTGVVDVRAYSWGTIALQADGNVLTAGEDNWHQQAMNGSVKDAVAVTAGEHFFVALKPDGTIHAVGQYANQLNRLGWHLGRTPPSAWQVRRRVVTRPKSAP